MGVVSEKTHCNWVQSSLWGMGRGIAVHLFIYPLEVIKIHLQCSNGQVSQAQMIHNLFKKNGILTFYQGLLPQLLKTCSKQMWCWPLITKGPLYLSSLQIGEISGQCITGIGIAAIDATLTTPLERSKMLSAFHGKVAYPARGSYWQGYTAHLLKLSAHWSLFLAAQKHLRTQAIERSGSPLSLYQLCCIGAQVGLIVSLVTAPIDMIHTRMQVQDANMRQLFSLKEISRSHRGWHLTFSSQVINYLASVILIAKVEG